MNDELFNEDHQEFDIIEYLNVLIYYRKLIILIINKYVMLTLNA